LGVNPEEAFTAPVQDNANSTPPTDFSWAGSPNGV